MGKPHLTATKFSQLNLHEALQESLDDNGYEYCTQVQEKALPKLLAGKDITGQAQTGTGKTATFLLATLHHLMTTPVEKDKKGPFALIIAPTRELAIQIYDDAEMLGRYTGLKFALLYGGAGYGKQREALENNADVVIGTVGRLIDFFKQRALNLREIEVLVLDEADRLFDLGFIQDIRYLIRKMPQGSQRLNMLFSATFSQKELELAYEHMNNPEFIAIEPEQITAERIEQSLYHVSLEEKLPLLFGLLAKEAPEKAIIFVNTKREAERLHAYLLANSYQAAVLSGDIPQRQRERLLDGYKEGKYSILVATDVAARGLHIEEVTHVFNYDLPQDREDYVHRIGRTARAGAKGKAISLACEEYVYSLPDIEEYITESIPVETIAEGLLVTPKKPERRRQPKERLQRGRRSQSNRKANNTHTRRSRGRSPHQREKRVEVGREERVEPKKIAENGANNNHPTNQNLDNHGTDNHSAAPSARDKEVVNDPGKSSQPDTSPQSHEEGKSQQAKPTSRSRRAQLNRNRRRYPTKRRQRTSQSNSN